jgi:hypothetical protein
MAGSESRTSTCRYKHGNGEMDEDAFEAVQRSKVLTRNEASEPTGYLQTGALDR